MIGEVSTLFTVVTGKLKLPKAQEVCTPQSVAMQLGTHCFLQVRQAVVAGGVRRGREDKRSLEIASFPPVPMHKETGQFPQHWGQPNN